MRVNPLGAVRIGSVGADSYLEPISMNGQRD